MKHRQPDATISILLDPDVQYEDKDEAALLLGDYDEPRALEALLLSFRNLDDEMLLSTHAESIVEIWRRNDSFDLEIYQSMPARSRRYLYIYIRTLKSEWIEQYGLPDENALPME